MLKSCRVLLKQLIMTFDRQMTSQYRLSNIIEFFHNYSKLTMLTIKTYVGKSKIKVCKKQLPPACIEPWTSCDPMLERLRLLRSLNSHDLLILAESSKSKSQLVH